VPPQQDRPFYIYLSVGDTSIASVVVQLYDGKEGSFLSQQKIVGCRNKVPRYGKTLSVFIFYMHQASPYPAIG
jgi:hypothetical protein